MSERRNDLRACLKDRSERLGAVAFGIVSPDDMDALPRIRVVEFVTRWSKLVREVMPEARSVIVFGVPSLDDSDELEVRRASRKFSYPGYHRIKLIQRDLESFLLMNGYRAAPIWELVSHKRLAVLAGIGAYGKSSLVISPRHGPWLRIGAVVTDAPIPKDRPFTKDLCGKCRRCVNACPSGALRPFTVDPKKCLVLIGSMDETPRGYGRMLEDHAPLVTPNARRMCTECQMACPYTPPGRRENVLVK